MVYRIYDYISENLPNLSGKLKFGDIIQGNFISATYTHCVSEDTIWKGRYRHGQKRRIYHKMFLVDSREFGTFYIAGLRNLLKYMMMQELLTFYNKYGK